MPSGGRLPRPAVIAAGGVVADIRLANAAKAYKGLSHQTAAWNWLNEQLAATPVLDRFAEMYRADPPEKPEPSPSPGRPVTSVLLKVPYECQNDNGPTGWRECFSSSCAMVARFWRPKAIASDDDYNRIRSRFGDTTDAGAQLRALGSLGLQASFKQNGDATTLERILREGRPVPVGWLHKGAASAPTGGGHWSVVVGFTAEAFIHNDPNGEADMVNGGYVTTKGTAGKGIAYSRKNWLRRWEADGRGSGWYLDVRG